MKMLHQKPAKNAAGEADGNRNCDPPFHGIGEQNVLVASVVT
jgi:hypothetical protein